MGTPLIITIINNTRQKCPAAIIKRQYTINRDAILFFTVRDSFLVLGVRPAHVCPGHTDSVLCLEISEMGKTCTADRNIRILFRLGVRRIQAQVLPVVFWFHFVSNNTRHYFKHKNCSRSIITYNVDMSS